MSAFTFTIVLSSLVGQQVLYSGAPQEFKDAAACERVLPKVETAVQAIIRHDPESLKLFGYVSGPITRAYFVTDGSCDDEQE